MGRPVVLSNGQLFVGLDEYGLVHDFYYPYVGLDNLTNARSSQHKIGVWVDGTFSWTNDGSWQAHVDFDTEALISNIRLRNDKLGLHIVMQDFVDPTFNAFIRRLWVTNDSGKRRDIRVFMHQVFQISRAGRGDTALFVPDDNYVLDYKGRCCLLVAGKLDGQQNFDQFAVGNYGIEGKAGTYKDAEDGELSGNAVEHGGVDSVIRFRKETTAGQTFLIDYWIIAAPSQSDAQVIHTRLRHHSIDDRLHETRRHWQAWLAPALQKTGGLPAEHRRAALKSLLIIKAHCDERGSILASGDSSIFNYGRDYYCYCWPRDAAYAVWPLIRLGMYDEARKFFAFARDTMHRDGYLMHKYQPDRAIGSTWHPLLHGNRKELAIQEDETASVLFMLGEYYRASKDEEFVRGYYHGFIAPLAHFMSDYIDSATDLPHPSYDLWEEKFLTSTYTVSTVIAGLQAAIRFAQLMGEEQDAQHWQQAAGRIKDHLDGLLTQDGWFKKGILWENDELKHDDTLDISNLYGPYMFAGLSLDDPRLIKTRDAVLERLQDTTPSGGVIRYEYDNYFRTKQQYKGNPWIVCSLWLAQYLISEQRTGEAKELLQWALARQLPSGVLGEQFDPEDGTPLGVTPLVWSHAEVVNTLLDLYNL